MIHKVTLKLLLKLWGQEETINYISHFFKVDKEKIIITYDYNIILK